MSKSEVFTGRNNRLPICNKCLEEYYNQYLEIYSGDVSLTIRRVCMMFDIYFHEDIVKLSKNGNMGSSRIGNYISRSNLQQYKDKTYDDTLREESQSPIIPKQEILETELNEDNKYLISEAKKLFGEAISTEDALYLKSEFDEWKVRTGAEKKSEEEIIKNICYNQLDLIKARANNKPTKDLEKTYLDNIKAGGWSPEKTDSNTLSDMNLGLWIQKIEQNKPIDEVDEKYKDVDNLKHYIDVWMVGHMGKSTGIKNIYVPEYENEILKYTVKKEIEDSDSDEGMKKLFGGDI